MTRLVLIGLVAACIGCKTGQPKPEEPPSPMGVQGFVVIPAADNRIWVFRWGSKGLEECRKQGEVAKHVTRPGAGPGGMTVKAPDAETIVDYAVSREGSVTFVREGRIWVFRPGSK